MAQEKHRRVFQNMVKFDLGGWLCERSKSEEFPETQRFSNAPDSPGNLRPYCPSAAAATLLITDYDLQGDLLVDLKIGSGSAPVLCVQSTCCL